MEGNDASGEDGKADDAGARLLWRVAPAPSEGRTLEDVSAVKIGPTSCDEVLSAADPTTVGTAVEPAAVVPAS